MGEVLLQMRGIQKYFPGVHALDDCHFELKSGEVHALVGENGAGKSTMMKVLTGVYQMDAGEILLDGKEIHIRKPMDAIKAGIVLAPEDRKKDGLCTKLSIRDNIAFGMTADTIEAELLSLNPVSFWTIDGLDARYYAAAPVAGTKWDAVCIVGFWDSYAKIISNLAPLVLIGLVILAGGFLFMYRSFLRQMESARTLEKSVEELQKKVYSDERPAGADIEDILELTSSGLSDGLTGTVTRSVFSSRLESVLENEGNDEKLYALCFVDLDDFKNINDTYGHATGDIALKSVGYLLREYERRYAGLVGRYGGDEFVLLMTDFDDEAELRDVLDELTDGLQVDIQSGDSVFRVGCSVGVSLWDHRVGADELMEQADQALYCVKQDGKGGYRVYQDEGER